MNYYDTVSETMNALKNQGFTLDLNIAFDKSLSKDLYLNPEKFKITQTFRFEGDSNPSDEDIVYAMQSEDGKLKGIFTGAFGLYANTIAFENLKLLRK